MGGGEVNYEMTFERVNFSTEVVKKVKYSNVHKATESM